MTQHTAGTGGAPSQAMRWLPFFFLALTACGRTTVARCENCVFTAPAYAVDAGRPPAHDAGVASDAGQPVDAGVQLACDGRPIGPDCCEGGQRVTSASCLEDRWVCERGAYCECGGAPQGFSCSDFCGSDIINPPACANGQWACGRGLVETSTCPADTCWGSPGDNCLDPKCLSGRWVCANSP